MSRGRGRGASNNKTFSREQLTSLGVTNNEVLPGPVLQPPPLYPMLERRPVQLANSVEMDYLLILKQDYIDHMQLSSAFVKSGAELKGNNAEQQHIDKLVAQLPSNREKMDWSLYPAELRPKLAAKRLKKVTTTRRDVNVEQTLKKLENMESREADKSRLDVTVKEEVEDEEDGENKEDVEEMEEVDDEMDDGTDYANNYFDNGEDYEDEDDNLDDGPVY